MASTLECIIAQRLVRRICEHCKVEDEVDPKLLEHIKAVVELIHTGENIDPALLQGLKFYKGKGCEKCDDVGYTGRVGLFEVMKMNNDIRRAILKRQNALEIEQIAMKSGMLTLEQSGILKALLGMTSLEEVYRVARKMEELKPAKTQKPQQKPKKQNINEKS
jgi:type IV pilus assembly protein PilB